MSVESLNKLKDDSTVSSQSNDTQEAVEPNVIEFTPESPLRHPVRMMYQIFQSIWSGRTLAVRMFVRNIKGLYRQTILGLFWVFLPPLANTALWVVLSKSGVTDFAEQIGPRYLIYVLGGMVLWQAFVEGIQAPLNAVQSNRHMLSKLRFPRESVLMVGTFDVLFNLATRALVLIPFMIWFECELHVGLLVVPISALFMVLLAIGMGCLIMPLGMLYQDVGRFLTVIIPLWMLATQIVYPPLGKTPADWAANPFCWANPASPLLLLTRDLLVLGQSYHWNSALVYAAITIPLCLIGLVIYRVSVPILVERVSN